MSRVGEPPLGKLPLSTRLLWTIPQRDNQLEPFQQKSLRKSSDHVQQVTIPFSISHQINFSTQILLLHRAHMRRHEHLVLDQETALSFVDHPERVPKQSLGGIIRSEELPLPAYIGDLIRNPKPEDVPQLLSKLVSAAENLFPYNAINPAVDKANIYHYLSAIQLVFSLIHPFVDGNGRVSEEIMYALWGRRPDLADTVRHVSKNGRRSNLGVMERDAIFFEGVKTVIRSVAKKMGITEPVDTYKELPGHYLLGKPHIKTHDFENLYFSLLQEELTSLLTLIDGNHTDELKEHRIINMLAINLQTAGRNYTLSDQTRISFPTTQKQHRENNLSILGRIRRVSKNLFPTN